MLENRRQYGCLHSGEEFRIAAKVRRMEDKMLIRKVQRISAIFSMYGQFWARAERDFNDLDDYYPLTIAQLTPVVIGIKRYQPRDSINVPASLCSIIVDKKLEAPARGKAQERD